MRIDKILNNELELLDIVEWGESGSLGEPPTEPEKKLTVGEEFIEWAEEYWGLKSNYDKPAVEGSESCPYRYVKDIFINKIDEIIRKRL